MDEILYNNVDGNDIKFVFRYITYEYNVNDNSFTTVSFNFQKSHKDIYKMSDGIMEDDHPYLKSKYGECTMNIIIEKWYKLLFQEVLNSFYFFQVFWVIIWALNGYYRSWIILGILAVLAIATELYDTIKNLERLKTMAYYECPIVVKRVDSDGGIVNSTINSSEIVPGDIIYVPEGSKMPCDAILLNGECVINEAMLTGESIPAIKSPLPHDNNMIQDENTIKNHYLFCGTEVVQNRKIGKIGAIALVTKTSFCTTKGGLIRSIMYSMPSRYDFYKDVYKILCVSMSIGLLGIFIILPTYWKYYEPFDIFTRASSLYTICIPAFLPIIMILGIMFGLRRLYAHDIYCTSPLKVNTAGRISYMVFDKTGTLTNDGLNAVGHKISHGRSFRATIKDSDNIVLNNEIWTNFSRYSDVSNDPVVKYLECMASCHSVTQLNEKFLGDPLETEMFWQTEWVLDEDEKRNTVNGFEFLASVYPEKIAKTIQQDEVSDAYQIRIVKRFEFSSDLQRMSVICKNNLDGRYMCFIKGSPEKMHELWNPDSIPEDFFESLEKYTNNGLRVIALGYRYLDNFNLESADECYRENVEYDIEFLGLLIFANKLKAITGKCIKELHEGKFSNFSSSKILVRYDFIFIYIGGVKTIMATGDNPLTAVSVARKCGIVMHSNYFIIDVDDRERRHLKFEKMYHERRSEGSIVVVEEGEEIFSQSDNRISETESKNSQASRRGSRTQPYTGAGASYKYHQSLVTFMRGVSDYEVAITGRAFELIVEMSNKNETIGDFEAQEILIKILEQGKVFSRMSPNQKAMLIEEIQRHTGELVGMWGDGANDCTALKTADVGLSLSEAEASIAAPFTSRTPNISSSVHLLVNGRASLDVSYVLFKYIMIASSVKYTSMILLAFHTWALADWQFGLINMILEYPIYLFTSKCYASEKLTPEIPHKSIMSKAISIEIIGQSLIQTIYQMVIYLIAVNMAWFDSQPRNSHFNTDTMESTVVCLASLPMHVFPIIVIETFTPFRQRIFENKILFATIILQILLVYWMIVIPLDAFKDFFDLKTVERWFLIVIVGASIVCFFVMFAFEYAVNMIFGRSEPLVPVTKNKIKYD